MLYFLFYLTLYVPNIGINETFTFQSIFPELFAQSLNKFEKEFVYLNCESKLVFIGVLWNSYIPNRIFYLKYYFTFQSIELENVHIYLTYNYRNFSDQKLSTPYLSTPRKLNSYDSGEK